MINEKIRNLRKRLNDSIQKEEDYETIYKLSVELDEVIAKYYNVKLKQKV